MIAEDFNPQPESSQQPKRRWLRWDMKKTTLTLLLSVFAFTIATTSLVYQITKVRHLEERVRELEWADFIQGQDSYSDTVEPSVGTIQFLRRGYSLEFEKVEYTPGGLLLAGFIGNSTQLWTFSLTLEFSAYQPRSSQREDFLREYSDNPYFLLLDPIGSSQARTIETLPPGGRQPFQVTIPNVKQTPQGIQLLVSFSGERYSYGS